MAESTVEELQQELYELQKKLNEARKQRKPEEVSNYTFKTLDGDLTLKQLFAGKKVLYVIHNMGQGCRYCTLWADGLNGFLPHLESEASVVLVSKDAPEIQRRFALSRGWRFRMASHGGGAYMQEQAVGEGGNIPGIVCYLLDGEKILKKNSAVFGPNDEFCSLWNILGLAGESEESWTPQYSYWKRPATLDDGGKNLV